MGHGTATIRQMLSLLTELPADSRILELGDQDLVSSTPISDIKSLLQTIHKDEEKARTAFEQFPKTPPWKAADLFRGSTYEYRCIDLFPGEFTILLDLNDHVVAEQDRSTFDLITNEGTTEHIGDQMNAFQAIHDYAKAGSFMVHQVPFGGYFNHGLYNYHPVFFVFLAHANDYEIVSLALSQPHLPFSLPEYDGLMNAKEWAGLQIESGIVGCVLRKTSSAPFRKVTDFDANALGFRELASPWREMVANRYDLRVRPSREP